MIFEKLADFILKHAKLVLIVWIVVLLASVYPALNSSEHLSYSTNSMGSSTSESMEGIEVMGDHFKSLVDTENVQMLLVTYEKGNEAQKEVARGATSYVMDKLLNDYGKISAVMGTNLSGETDPSSDGLVSLAIIYKAEYDSQKISDDTGDLRKYIDKQMDAYASESGKDISVLSTYVAGSPAIAFDASTAMSKDMARVDPISIFLILVLVGLFFRSFVSSAAPPITIGVAFALVMASMFFLGQLLDIFYIVEMLLLVSMLGAGCDYCIFILSRYREERRAGREHRDAAKEAIMWAGESVFTSGAAVMIGFGSMMICDFNLISTLGLGLAIGIVFALLAALTLMSSLVVLLGDKLFWPSGASGPKLEKGYIKAMGNLAHKYFLVSTRFSIKHAKLIVVVTILFTVPMAYVYATSNTSYDMIGSMMTGESQEGMIVMSDFGDGGSAMPNYALIQTSEPMATVMYIGGSEKGIGLLTLADASVLAKVTTANAELKDKVLAIDDNVGGVEYLTFDFDIGGTAYPKTWSTLVTIMVAQGMVTPDKPLSDGLTALSQAPMFMSFKPLIDAMQTKLTPQAQTMITMAIAQQTGYTMDWTVSDPYVAKIMDWAIYVATGQLGETMIDENNGVCDYYQFKMSTKAQAMDDVSIDTVGKFSDTVHAYIATSDIMKAAWVTGTAAVMVEISDMMTEQFLKIEITAIILILLLLLIVMKSYLTPIRAVATIFMSVVWTVAVTQLVYTDLLGKGVLWILPIMLLVICLGLGMDYDILLTTRIREYRFAKGMSNDEAISQAVLHSGSVITICGFIMAGTFGTMMLSSTVMLQQMGFALAFAILVDALIVRTYIVPAVMHLMGEWNWFGPGFLKGTSKLGRKDAGKLGILAGAVMLICAAIAYCITGAGLDVVDMDLLMCYSDRTELVTKIGFGLGGALVIGFGALMAYANRNPMARIAGIAFAASGALTMVAALTTIQNVSTDHMWIIAFAVAAVASVIFAAYAASGKHGMSAGLMMIAIIGLGGAALSGALTYSFGLMLFAAASVLFAAICEYAQIE